MKKIEEFLHELRDKKSGTLSALGQKVFKGLMIAVIIVVLIILTQIGMFLGIFDWLENEVRLLTGIDSFLVKGIALILMAVLFGTPLSGFIWSFLPIPQKNKKKKRLILLLILAVFFFAAYFASRNVYFNPSTGEPVKYYAVDPDGNYRISSSKGYDPVTGEKLKPVDKKVATENYFGESSRNLVKKENCGNLTINSTSNSIKKSTDNKKEKVYITEKNIKITSKGWFLITLAKGQTSGWIKIDKKFSYGFSNPSAKVLFYVTYEDGTIVKSGKVVWFQKDKFRVTNLSDRPFHLIVE